MHGDTMNARETQNIIETILFRRALEHKLEGYTLETSVEISEALKSDKRLNETTDQRRTFNE